jgi:hypothetical protein
MATGRRVLPDGGIEELGKLSLRPSPLRPDCQARERIFLWRGVNHSAEAYLGDPVLQHLADEASRASLKDAASYGAGLRKFHIFCDVFSVPEDARLPASYDLLRSFAMWAVTDPDPQDTILAGCAAFEPVAVRTAKGYLSAVRAWHLAQGWPPPLSDDDLKRMQWTMRGAARLEAGRRTLPPRPPITLRMMATLERTLDLRDSFDAAVWAIATCAFWGMMRFGEVTVNDGDKFDGRVHVKRGDARVLNDERQGIYARLRLPTAKTAKPGQTQDVFLPQQHAFCPVEALAHLARVAPAPDDAHLFSWIDRRGRVYP